MSSDHGFLLVDEVLDVSGRHIEPELRESMLTLSYGNLTFAAQDFLVEIQFIFVLLQLSPLVLTQGDALGYNFRHQGHEFPLVPLYFFRLPVQRMNYLPREESLARSRVRQVVRAYSVGALKLLRARVV